MCVCKCLTTSEELRFRAVDVYLKDYVTSWGPSARTLLWGCCQDNRHIFNSVQIHRLFIQHLLSAQSVSYSWMDNRVLLQQYCITTNYTTWDCFLMHYISFLHIWCHLESDGLRSVGQLETMLYMFLIICGPPGYSRNVRLMVLAEGKPSPTM